MPKTRIPKFLRQPLGLALIVLGLGLLSAAGGYYLYSMKSRADLGALATNPSSGSVTSSLPPGWQDAQRTQVEEPSQVLPVPLDNSVPPGTQPEDAGPIKAQGIQPPPDSTSPQYLWADWNTLPKTSGSAPVASRIVIPAIGVDAPAVELSVVWDGESRLWQRPKNSVGHHQGTANPGEIGNSVMSGHINSPIRGEGKVFQRLPEIPQLIKNAAVVEVFVYTPAKTYVYQVVKTDVLKPEDLNVFATSDKPTLTLITCVPDLVFSDRLVVTALLVKVADGGAPYLGYTVNGQVVSPR